MTSRRVVEWGELPGRIDIYEVGARDGLQNESVILPTAVKAEFIHRLSAAGLATVEATSLVRADRVPALADAEDLLAHLDLSGTTRYPVLVPNMRGFDRALELGVREIAVFASATETFAHRNLGRGVEESLEMFKPVVAAAASAGMPVRGYVSMCWVDPWEGDVDPDKVVDVALRLIDFGCEQISLGDTIGAATPGAVVRLLARLVERGVPGGMTAVHFHDTYGQALSNTLTAMRAGITTVDSSAGGLGGCPFAMSATGNLATEDLVWQLDGLGIATGVDLTALVETSAWMAEKLGRPSPSAVVRALAPTLIAGGSR